MSYDVYPVVSLNFKNIESIMPIFREDKGELKKLKSFSIDKEKATSLYIGYRVTKSFAEIHLGKTK